MYIHKNLSHHANVLKQGTRSIAKRISDVLCNGNILMGQFLYIKKLSKNAQKTLHTLQKILVTTTSLSRINVSSKIFGLISFVS